MSLFVRFNQRLENNRYPCPSASRTHKHPGVIERGRWVKTTPVWPGGVRLSCAFFGPHKEQSAGYNSRTESQRVCGECHRSSRAVCFYGTGCFNGAVVSPSLRLWTDDRRDSRLNLDPSKTTLWIWNGACRWAKFSASEKHQNHGQSSAVSAKSCWISPPLSLCVCWRFPVAAWRMVPHWQRQRPAGVAAQWPGGEDWYPGTVAAGSGCRLCGGVITLCLLV